ncbi:hypothetical protein SCHPADRAFT_905059 [Schizopora paradoxa]|uniref:Uncharacterized protein n=1 Tax=Schizopora paradoxa TaxID=27342 RepID=A0A0H2RKL9_9AGAM|nr:hypothetical protein SCHPADRAFT_905059 [Schizopora paradoxa]
MTQGFRLAAIIALFAMFAVATVTATPVPGMIVGNVHDSRDVNGNAVDRRGCGRDCE